MRFKCIFLLVLLCACGLCSKSWAVTFPDDWNFQARLQINPASVFGSFTDFPILITVNQLPPGMMDAVGADNALPNGADIRFSSDSAGNIPLAFEIVSFATGASPRAEMWVKVPTLSNLSTTNIYVWWGNSSATLPAFTASNGRNAVWSNNYRAVWHLEETPSATVGVFKDSTGNNFNSTNTTALPALATGTIGRASQFSGAQRIFLSNTLDTPTNFTIQGWVSTTNMSGFRSWIGKSDSFAHNDIRWRFFNDASGTSNPGIGTANNQVQWINLGANYAATAAHYNMIVNTSASTAQLVHNGVVYAAQTFTQGTDAAAAVSIGTSVNEYWTGIIDEVRISTITRSTTWIRTEYSNQNNQNTNVFFNSIGPIVPLNNRYWLGSTSNAWNNPQNWSYSSAGAAGATVPNANNAVIFDAGSNNNAAVISNPTQILSLLVSNYSGSISVSGTQTLTVNSNITIQSGTINLNNALLQFGGDLHIQNPVTLNAGSSTLSSIGVLAKNMNLNGKSLRHLNINGSGNVSLTSPMTISGDLNILTSSLVSNQTLNLAGNLVVNAPFTQNGAALTFNGNTIISGTTEPTIATIIVSGTLENQRSVNTSVVTVNGLLINNSLLYVNTPFINFNSYTINSYAGGQDAVGTYSISPDGSTLTLEDNTWKSINFPYTITTNTILSFDYLSTERGEIHGIGFDTDNNLTENFLFALQGTQNYGLNTYKNYVVNGGWRHYDIPMGTFYTGNHNYIYFVNDNDATPLFGNGSFRNVRVREAAIPTSIVNVSASGTLAGNGSIEGTVNIANNGTLSPGNSSSATLSVSRNSNSGLILNNNSNLRFDLGTLSDRVDLIATANNLTLDGNLNVSNAGGLAAGTYTLFTYTGTLTNNTLNVSSMPLGYNGVIDLSVSNQVNLTVTEQVINLVWTNSIGSADLGIAPKAWFLGVMVAGSQSSPQSHYIRNQGNVPLNVSISSSSSLGAGWVSSSAVGANQYVINVNNISSPGLSNNLAISRQLSNNLGVNAFHTFDLYFSCPTSSTTSAAQSITITILATAP